MTPDPEPDGTRMQVVKGFSALTFDVVEPALGPKYSFNRRGRPTRSIRDSIEANWPQWDARGHCWRFSYGRTIVGRHAGDLCRVRLDPSGHALLMCYDRDGAAVVAEEGDFAMVAVGPTPVQAMFDALTDSWGPRIGRHLAAATRR